MGLGGCLSTSKAKGPSAASAQALLTRGGEARVRLSHRQAGLPGGCAAFPESHEHPCSAAEAGIWHTCFPSKESGAVSRQRWELHAQCPAQSWSSNPWQSKVEPSYACCHCSHTFSPHTSHPEGLHQLQPEQWPQVCICHSASPECWCFPAKGLAKRPSMLRHC